MINDFIVECTRPLVHLRHTLFATKESTDEAKGIHNAGLMRERKTPMALGKRQPKWDIYEAAILLDGYLEVLRANQPKARIVKRISQDLRRMAMRRGMTIDDAYRDEKGIFFQIRSVESTYQGEKVHVPATRLFDEVVELYHADKRRYYKILEEAKNMATAKQSNQEAFLAWTTSVLSAQRRKQIEINILKIERFAIASKLISGSIFDVTDLATLERIDQAAGKNKEFQVKNIIGDLRVYMQYCSQLLERSGQTDEPEPSSVLPLAGSISAINAPMEVENGFHVVDFASEESMRFTKPREVFFLGKEFSIPSTWKDVYVSVVSALYEAYPDMFATPISFPGSARVEFGKADDLSCMTEPKEISEGLCIETNFSATDFVKRIKMLLSMCGVSYDSLKIVYERRAGTTISSNAQVDDADSATVEYKFYAYLRDNAKLTERTCSSYISSIRSAERYAADNGYASCSLFGQNRETTIATVTELYGDTTFIKYNEQQHNRFSAAIHKLLEFIGAEISERVVVSPGDDWNSPTVSELEANSGVIAVLKQHYAYGFKYDSIRELMRFRQFADAMGIALPEKDEALKAAILSSGIVIGDKIYCKRDDMTRKLRHMIDDAFSSGTSVIYYESLFQNEQEWMEAYVITSPDMLKAYLQKSITGCSFAKNFMVKGERRSEKEAVTDELKRIWGEHLVESVENLSNRLSYIPLRNIWRVISGNAFFVLASEGKYLLIDRFRITKEEEKRILEFVDEAYEENGYASLSDVPLGDLAEENYELTQPAIYHAIYKKVLSDRYYLNGKILTKERSELNAVMLLKQYIKDREECTLDEVVDKVVELTGATNRQYAFQALYDNMVRVDRNRFVSTQLVDFSIDEIDTVLAECIPDNFCAIRDVTTFALFPICGQSWNHYLLESFCYKYSRKYSLHVIHFNDKNAGIIAEKDFRKDYNEMLAIALARSDVELSSEVIGRYLFNTGYMAKSKYARLDKIARRSLQLRKER